MTYNGLTNTGAIYLATRQANKLPVEFLKGWDSTIRNRTSRTN